MNYAVRQAKALRNYKYFPTRNENSSPTLLFLLVRCKLIRQSQFLCSAQLNYMFHMLRHTSSHILRIQMPKRWSYIPNPQTRSTRMRYLFNIANACRVFAFNISAALARWALSKKFIFQLSKRTSALIYVLWRFGVCFLVHVWESHEMRVRVE